MNLSPRFSRLDKNFLVGGGFHYWQRAITGSVSNTFYVDRSRIVFLGGASPSIDQVTDVPNGKTKYALKFTNTQDSQVNTVELKHNIESIYGLDLASEQVSMGFWIKTAHATTIRLKLSVANVEDDFSAVTEFHNSTQTMIDDNVYRFIAFENISVPATSGQGVQVLIEMENFSDLVNPTSFTIAQMKLNIGEKAQSFSHAGRDLLDELEKCQRFCEIPSVDPSTSVSTESRFQQAGFVTNTNTIGVLSVFYQVKKRAVPTFTLDTTTANWRLYFTASGVLPSGVSSNHVGLSCATLEFTFTANTAGAHMGVGYAVGGDTTPYIIDAELN